ncbi:MAG: BTAD domain-containing putative transcriptional regulator, partial [Rhodovibrionaceae bacterium]|nr:BTAD domain-containing putative transcriptional regulator [Rhodovibrionaceae bacterium]
MSGNRIPLKVYALGRAQVCTAADHDVHFPTRKDLALILVLARQPGIPVSREKLADLLWGTRDEQHARSSLRQALIHLRKSLSQSGVAAEILASDSSGVRLAAGSVWTDAVAFQELAASQDPADWERALELYGGPFLDGFELVEPGFEEWLTFERSRLHDLARQTGARLVERAEDESPGELIRAAHSLLAIDRLDETGHRALMRGYAARGQRAQAVEQYRAYAELLRSELDVQPDRETEILAQHIRNGDNGASGEAPGESGPETSAPVRDAGPSAQRDPPPNGISKRWRWAAAAAALVAVIGTAGLVREGNFGPEFTPASTANMALPLPDKPSLAVLAFENMGERDGDRILGEAIAENIITELSRFSELFVISRNSSFTYKGLPVKVQKVAEDLGVQYIVEGSVQRADGRIRVNVQLVDALNGRHLWAERYNREANDVFEIQEEITRTIVATVQRKVLDLERARAVRKDPANLEAYEHVIRGWKLWLDWTKEAHAQAKVEFEKALAQDPDMVRALTGLAKVYVAGHRYGWQDIPRDRSLQKARQLAGKALLLAPLDYHTHYVMGGVHYEAGENEQALMALERALELNPNSADVMALEASVLVYVGRFDDAIQRFRQAMRLNPHFPSWWWWNMSWAQYHAGDYEGALKSLRRMRPLPNAARRMLAMVYVR